MEERKFYETSLAFYINDMEVCDFTLNGFYYGYPQNFSYIPKEVKDIRELYSILCNLDLGNEIQIGFRKVKIFGVTFKKKDIKEIKIIQIQRDNTLYIRETYNFNRLMKELTINEFTQFCIDNGLAVNPNK